MIENKCVNTQKNQYKLKNNKIGVRIIENKRVNTQKFSIGSRR